MRMVRPGDRVGKYTLGRRLGGESGQGEVYLATDDRGIQFAVKVPKGEVRRFSRELDAARAVRSPHVARVWDFDLDCDPPVIAYDVVPGHPLDRVLSERQLTVVELLDVFSQVAQGLADIHAVSTETIPQLSHGDLSLDNIMVTDRNEAVVIDLGAARTGHGETLSRDLFGKYGYFAPEQLAEAAAGPEADIWQLGVCMVRATAGHMPFGNGPHSLLAVRDDPPNVIGLPGAFGDVVAACLSKDPAARPTASEIVELADVAAAMWRTAEQQFWVSVFEETTVRPVTAVSFHVLYRGVVQRRATIDISEGQRGHDTSPCRSDVAVGDPVLRPVEIHAWASLGDFYSPDTFRPSVRELVAAPTLCPCCEHRLVPLEGNWRALSPWLMEGPSNEGVYCPDSAGCRQQHKALWREFVSETGLHADRDVWFPLCASGAWPAALVACGPDQFPSETGPIILDRWSGYAHSRQRLAWEASLNSGVLLRAMGCPSFNSYDKGPAPQGKRREHPGLLQLLDGAAPDPACDERAKWAMEQWWAERGEYVRDVALALVPHIPTEAPARRP